MHALEQSEPLLFMADRAAVSKFRDRDQTDVSHGKIGARRIASVAIRTNDPLLTVDVMLKKLWLNKQPLVVIIP